MALRAARAGAALLALAAVLACGACKPSSLTPFGIDRRAPLAPGFNGQWEGSTESGGAVSFLVASDEVTTITLAHREAGCVERVFDLGDNPALVQDGTFRSEIFLDPAGRIVVEGTFAASDRVSGTYFFEGLPRIAPCSASGS